MAIPLEAIEYPVLSITLATIVLFENASALKAEAANFPIPIALEASVSVPIAPAANFALLKAEALITSATIVLVDIFVELIAEAPMMSWAMVELEKAPAESADAANFPMPKALEAITSETMVLLEKAAAEIEEAAKAPIGIATSRVSLPLIKLS